MAICGDGSTSNGRWHEALNWSAVHQLPVVWVVNNNQYAYSTPNPLEFHVPTIAERAVAYGMPGVRVDGGDVLEVFEAALEAVERARDGGGPTLIESVSLRWRGHAGHDPAKYMPDELLAALHGREGPRAQLRGVPARARASSRRRTSARCRSAWRQAFNEGYEFAQASPFPEPGDVTKGLWVEDGYWTSEPGRGGGTES